MQERFGAASVAAKVDWPRRRGCSRGTDPPCPTLPSASAWPGHPLPKPLLQTLSGSCSHPHHAMPCHALQQPTALLRTCTAAAVAVAWASATPLDLRERCMRQRISNMATRSMDMDMAAPEVEAVGHGFVPDPHTSWQHSSVVAALLRRRRIRCDVPYGARQRPRRVGRSSHSLVLAAVRWTWNPSTCGDAVALQRPWCSYRSATNRRCACGNIRQRD